AVAQPRARVLVIHPSDQALRLVRHRLNDRYEMITSSDPEAALDKIMAYQPDILVLSDPMPLFHPEHYRKLLGTNAHLQVNHHATLRRISTENGENANPDIVQLMKDLDEVTS